MHYGNKCFIVLLILPSMTGIFPAQCPHYSQYRLRGLAICKDNSNGFYICLHNTENDSKKELCKQTLDYSPPGQMYVWTGGFNNVDCSDGHFQPFSLWENENDMCLFKKSLCAELGQVIFQNRLTLEDRYCRCDHTAGYAFMTIPKNMCYCVPSEEDCSCYLKQCSYNQTLTSDYQCSLMKEATVKSKCISPSLLTNHTIRTPRYEIADGSPKGYTNSKTPLYILSGFCIFLFILGISIFILIRRYPERFNNLLDLPEKTLPLPERSDINDPRKTKHLVQNTNDVVKNSSIDSNKTCGKPYKMPVIKMQIDRYNGTPGGYVTIVALKPHGLKLHAVNWIHMTDNIENVIVLSSNGKKYKGDMTDNPTLTINELSLKDEGRYKCQVKDEFGKEILSDATYLKINMEKPIICVSRETLGYAGKSVEIFCYVDYPCSTLHHIQWTFRNGSGERIIKHTDEKYSRGTIDNPSLTINDLSPDDGGDYECQATNEIGTSTGETKLSVLIAVPIIYFPSTNKTGYPESSVTLSCKVLHPHSTLKYIEWIFVKGTTENVIDLTNQKKYAGGTIETPSLTIHCLTPKDAGQYKLRATNETGSGSSELILLTIICQKPELLTEPRNYVGVAGTSIKLGCFVYLSHTTLEKLEWVKLKKGAQVEIDVATFSIKYSGGTANTPSLTINNLTYDDAGFYKCKATNEVGTETSKKMCVAVKACVPIVNTCCNMREIEHGKKTTLTFLVIAEPKPTEVVFKKVENGVVKEMVATSVCSVTDIPYIYIYFLNTSFSGTYTCNASNIVGSGSSKEVRVDVKSNFCNIFDAVAALDIGSTQAKCAFASLGTCNRIASNIYSCRAVSSSETLSVPTCVVIKKSTGRVTFGNEARRDYENSIRSKESNDCLFFENFKKDFYMNKSKFVVDIHIEDTTGQPTEAIAVVTEVVRALQNTVIEEIKERKIATTDEKILWVVPIPSTWSNGKEFMRHCCSEAGINESNMMFVNETTAAALYHIRHSTQGIKGRPLKSEVGTKYLAVDIGGNTCQISALKMLHDEDVMELCTFMIPYGSKMLHEEFSKLLENAVGDKVIDSFQKNEITYLEVITQLETAKREFPLSTTFVDFTFPVNVVNDLCQKFHGRTFKEVLECSGEKEKIQTTDTKIRIRKDVFTALFNNITDAIISEINKCLKQFDSTDLMAILFAGGLLNSRHVRKTFKEAFLSMTCIFTDETDFAVAKGAIVYGCKPRVVTTRISQYSYGRRIRPRFIEGTHDPKKRVKDQNGPDRCKDVFEKFINKKEKIPIGHKVTITYRSVYPRQANISIAIYISRKENPSYVDEESCTKLCEFEVNIPYPSRENRFVDVELEFCVKHLSVKTTDRKTKTETSRQFSLMCDD